MREHSGPEATNKDSQQSGMSGIDMAIHLELSRLFPEVARGETLSPERAEELLTVISIFKFALRLNDEEPQL